MLTPCPSGKPASARPRWNSAKRYAVSVRDRPLRKPRSGTVACARAALASNPAAAQAPKTNSRRLTRSPHRNGEERWWDREAEGLRGAQVGCRLKFRGLLRAGGERRGERRAP